MTSADALPSTRGGLLDEFRRQHSLYRGLKENRRFWQTGLFLAVLLAAVLVGPPYLLGYDRQPDVITLGVVVAFPALRVLWLRAIVEQSARHAMNRLKAELDCAGYRVCCDCALPSDRPLMLMREPPKDPFVTVEPLGPLAFGEYQRRFRL